MFIGYLRQDGDAEGLAGVRGPEVDGQLGEKPPGGLSLHPTRELAAIPEPRRKVLDLTRVESKRNRQRATKTHRVRRSIERGFLFLTWA